MEDQKKQEVICVSVFKSVEHAVLRKQFTRKWAELINRMEKDKMIYFK